MLGRRALVGAIIAILLAGAEPAAAGDRWLAPTKVLDQPAGMLFAAPDGSVYLTGYHQRPGNYEIVDVYRRSGAGGGFALDGTIDAAFPASAASFAEAPDGSVLMAGYGDTQTTHGDSWPMVATRTASGGWGSWTKLAAASQWGGPTSGLLVGAGGRVWASFEKRIHAKDTFDFYLASRDPSTGHWSDLQLVVADAPLVTTSLDDQGRPLLVWQHRGKLELASWDGKALVDEETFAPLYGPALSSATLHRAANGATLLTMFDGTTRYGMVRPPGGSWSSPAPLPASWALEEQIYGGRDGFLIGRTEVVANDTAVALTVQEWPGSQPAPSPSIELVRAPIGKHQPGGEVIVTPRFAIDPLGNALVVFEQDGDAGSSTTLRYAFRPAGSSHWGSDRPLPALDGYPNTSQIQVTSDSQGDFVAAWTSSQSIGNGVTLAAGFDAAPPVLRARVPRSARRGARVHMSARARDVWAGLRGNLTWRFGDGARGSGRLVQHAYRRPGRYTVAVTARDRLGHRATRTATIVVAARTHGPRR